MGTLAVCGGRFPVPEESTAFVSGTILCREEWIQEVRIQDPGTTELAGEVPTLDATGCVVLPGFVDVHIHGSAGVDVMDASRAGLARLSRFLARHGVTGFLPTTITAPQEALLAAVEAVAGFMEADPPGARALGVHLEGPYISPRYPGAQPVEHIRRPDPRELAALAAAGPVRLITLAPEVPGAHGLMAQAQEAGIGVVIGHTAATYEEAQDAIRRGASQATHTFNAMTGLHHRRPGVVGAVLHNDAIYAQLIPDTIHVHPAAMDILARCKGPERTLLITDAIRAAGMPPGTYELGGQEVVVSPEGTCRLPDGTLAGSIVTMDQGLRHFLAATGWPLERAWPVTSRTPAQALGMDHVMGCIAPGYRADLVLLDAHLEVVATVVGGRVVFDRRTEAG